MRWLLFTSSVDRPSPHCQWTVNCMIPQATIKRSHQDRLRSLIQACVYTCECAHKRESVAQCLPLHTIHQPCMQSDWLSKTPSRIHSVLAKIQCGTWSDHLHFPHYTPCSFTTGWLTMQYWCIHASLHTAMMLNQLQLLYSNYGMQSKLIGSIRVKVT